MAQLQFADATVEKILGPGGLVSELHEAYEPRRPQIQLSQLFEQAIDLGEHAVTEAETGTGKTFAYLIPAIQAALQPGGPVVIVSVPDKNLQNQLILKDIPFIQGLFTCMGKEVRAVLMKGRGNFVCLNQVDKLTGRQELESALELLPTFNNRDASLQWREYHEWIKGTDDGDIDDAPMDVHWELRSETTVDSDGCLGRKCSFYEDCFVERRKEKARKAHVIVVNHSLLLRDLQVRHASHGLASVIPIKTNDDDGSTNAIVIIDEAHVLEDQATEAFATEITLGRFYWISNRIDRFTVDHRHRGKDAERPSVYGGRTREASEWSDVVHSLVAAAKAYVEQWTTRIDQSAKKTYGNTLPITNELGNIQFILDTLEQLAVDMDNPELVPHWLDTEEVDMWEKVAGAVRKLRSDMQRVLLPEPKGQKNWVRYAEKDSRDRITLYAKLVDVSKALRARLWNLFPSVLATSATLAMDGDFTQWKGRVGVEKAREIAVKSPFNYKKYARIYLPRNSEGFDPSKYYDAGSEAYYNRVADECFALIEASDGGAFVLFTSRRVLDQVFNRLAPRIQDRWPLFYHSTTANRGQMIRDFKAHDNAVLMGLDSFWQGVDVQGTSLRLVIIDKLPFPPPGDPVWDARRDAVVEKTGNKWAWLDQLSIPFATTKLKQGVGRLIRKGGDQEAHDYGVIALLDGRLITKRYGLGILKSLPDAPRIRGLNDVQAFFKERQEDRSVA